MKGLNCHYEILLADDSLEMPHRWWYWGQDCFIFINSLKDRTERQTVGNVILGGVVNTLKGRTAIQMDS